MAEDKSLRHTTIRAGGAIDISKTNAALQGLQKILPGVPQKIQPPHFYVTKNIITPQYSYKSQLSKENWNMGVILRSQMARGLFLSTPMSIGEVKSSSGRSKVRVSDAYAANAFGCLYFG